jgi:hypothetical protein
MDWGRVQERRLATASSDNTGRIRMIVASVGAHELGFGRSGSNQKPPSRDHRQVRTNPDKRGFGRHIRLGFGRRAGLGFGRRIRLGFGRRAGRWLRSARRRLGSFGGEFALIQIVKERSKDVLPGSLSNSEQKVSWEDSKESSTGPRYIIGFFRVVRVVIDEDP